MRKLQVRYIRYILLGLLLVFLFVLPQLGNQYITYLVTHVLLLSLFAFSVNLLLGYTGLLSFGQAAFYAAGAYGCAKILLAMDSPSLFPALLGGILIAGVLALILGFLCVRHTEIYFAMLTLCFGMMVYSILIKWRSMTGGDDGLVGIPRAPLEIPGIFSINVSSLGNYYYFVLIISIIAIFILYRFINSPFGLSLRGIRDSESRVAFTGISVYSRRLIGFVVAGLYAGLAGSLLPPLEHTITPSIANWEYSGEGIMICLLGGIYSFPGPIVGALLFYVIKDIVMRLTEYWLICFGIIVMILVLVFRGGVVGALGGWLYTRFKKRFTEEVYNERADKD